MKLKIYGSMLHLVILKMIAEREGKEWPEQYLWLKTISRRRLIKCKIRWSPLCFHKKK